MTLKGTEILIRAFGVSLILRIFYLWLTWVNLVNSS